MTRYAIVNAPSKFDLMVAFFDRPNPDALGGRGRRAVQFSIEKSADLKFPEQIEVVINTLAWEDGSGESWTFEGFANNWSHTRVKGWFRTSDRKGFVNIGVDARA